MATIRQYDNNNIVITEDSGVELMIPPGVVPQKRGTSIYFLNSELRTVASYAATEITEVTDKDGTATTITDIDTLYNTLRDSFFFRVAGGNGLGAIPFAIRSTDSLPAVFTSIANRDTYYTTTAPGDIANNTELGRGREAVGIGPTDGNTVGVTAAFIRNAANDDWIPIATNFIGPEGPASTTPGPQGPAGDLFPSVAITADVTINVANLSTYQNTNILNTSAGLGQVTVTLDTIANLIPVAPSDGLIFRFVNESASSTMVITPGTNNFFAQIAGNVTLNQGQALWIRLPLSGTRWNVFTESSGASSGTVPPTGPTALPSGNVEIVGSWDPNSGSFPANASQGDLYEITASATFDNIAFFRGDFLIAEVPGPSTTTFAGNWGVVPGKGAVHSLFGRQGVIGDSFMITNLDRLGYVRNSGIVNPSFHEFSITTIANRVDLNTVLNGSQTIRFSVTNHGDVASATVQADPNTQDDFEDVGTLVVPTIDGVQTQDIVFSGLTTNTAKIISFRIRAIDNQGNVHISNEYDVDVRNLSTNEFAYYGVLATENQAATVDLSTLTSVDVTNSGTIYNISESIPNTHVLVILSPDNRDPISIFNTVSNREAIDTFNSTTNVRTENGTQYNLRVSTNNSGFQGTGSYRITTE